MRKRALQGLAASTFGRPAVAGAFPCHEPFAPQRPGVYTLQQCPLCGNSVPLGERVEGTPIVFQMTVRSPYERKENK